MAAVLHQEPMAWLLITSILYYVYVMFFYAHLGAGALSFLGYFEMDPNQYKSAMSGFESVFKALFVATWFAFWIKDLVFMVHYNPVLTNDADARHVYMFALSTAVTIYHIFVFLSMLQMTGPITRNIVYGWTTVSLVLYIVAGLIVVSDRLVTADSNPREAGILVTVLASLMLGCGGLFVAMVDVKQVSTVEDMAQDAGLVKKNENERKTGGSVLIEEFNSNDEKYKGHDVALFPETPGRTILVNLPLSFIFFLNLFTVFVIMEYYDDYGRFWVSVALRVLYPALATLWTGRSSTWLSFFFTGCLVEAQAFLFYSGWQWRDTTMVNSSTPYIPATASNAAWRHTMFFSDWYDSGDTNPLAFITAAVGPTYWVIAGLMCIPCGIFVLTTLRRCAPAVEKKATAVAADMTAGS